MRISDRVRQIAWTQSASPELRERIARRLDAEDARVVAIEAAPSARWRLASIATALAAAAVLLLALAQPPRLRDAAAPLLAHATLGLDTEGALSSEDPRELGAWLGRQLGYPVEVPEILNARLMGGRVATLDGVRTASLTYELNGQPLTYFAMPDSRLFGQSLHSDRVVTIAADGYHVATWAESGAARAIVSPLPKLAVTALAEECKRKAAT